MALASQPALAQADRDDAAAGEIIVTARKRQESILKVPVVLTALAPNNRTRAGQGPQRSRKEGDRPPARPGVGRIGQPGLDARLRHQRARSGRRLFGLAEPRRPADHPGQAFQVGFFDMPQVEVLKGPQALFFGKASPAGVISIRTNDPGDELEVIGHRLRVRLQGMAQRTDPVGTARRHLRRPPRRELHHFGGFFKNNATPNTPIGIALGSLPMPNRFGENKSIMFGARCFQADPRFQRAAQGELHTRQPAWRQPGQLIACPKARLPIFFSLNEDCKADRNVAVVGMNPAASPA